MKAWLAIAIERAVLGRALKVAAVVGTILAIINHGEAIASGQATFKHWIQIGLTYLVPYCVSTFAAVQAIRHLRK